MKHEFSRLQFYTYSKVNNNWRCDLCYQIVKTMTDTEDIPNKPETELDDEALEKLAVEELMKEAVQGAARAEIVGPSGWVKGSQQKTNKRFLVNTIRNAVSSNKFHYSRSKRYSRRSPERDHHPEPTIKKDRSKRKH